MTRLMMLLLVAVVAISTSGCGYISELGETSAAAEEGAKPADKVEADKPTKKKVVKEEELPAPKTKTVAKPPADKSATIVVVDSQDDLRQRVSDLQTADKALHEKLKKEEQQREQLLKKLQMIEEGIGRIKEELKPGS